MENFTISRFDEAMDLYMSSVFGGNNAWRGTCHRAAKIAAAALKEIFPNKLVQAVRVELLAYMDGGKSYAHFGWKGDSRVIEGQYPMHWAVRLGEDLYDPTFWQLRKGQMALRLPATPYFFAKDWFQFARSGQMTDADGVTWVSDGAKPKLNVGYVVRDDELPPEVVACLMPDDVARLHGRIVRVATGLRLPA